MFIDDAVCLAERKGNVHHRRVSLSSPIARPDSRVNYILHLAATYAMTRGRKCSNAESISIAVHESQQQQQPQHGMATSQVANASCARSVARNTAALPY